MEIEEIQSSRKFERSRVIAILDASLALSMLTLCGFTFTFIYAVNEDTSSEVLFVILVAPFTLNALQLILGILLLCVTRKNTRHLSKCRTWCFTANFLSALIVLEILILFHWEFRTLAFVIFGMQYLIRISAIRKLQNFMENLMRRNPPNSIVRLSLAGGNFEHLTDVSCAVPLHTRVTSSVSVDISQIDNATLIAARDAELETPPPSYTEAFGRHVILTYYSDEPPTYHDALKQKARNYSIIPTSGPGIPAGNPTISAEMADVIVEVAPPPFPRIHDSLSS